VKLWDCFATAVHTLLSHKLRSFLTMLGILIGVASVISMVSLVRGEQAMISESFESLGANLIFVTPGAASSGGGMGGAFASTSTLTLEDAEAIADNAPSVLMVAAATQSTTDVIAGGENVGCLTLGVTTEYQYVRNFEVEEGRFISELDYKGTARVVVLGSELSETLFGQMSPIDQTIRMSGRQFKVVGVLKSKGEAFGTEDQAAMVPLSTALAILSSERMSGGEHIVQGISVQAKSKEALGAAQWEIGNILRQRHHLRPEQDDDFRIISMGDVSRTADEMYAVGELIMGAIAGISLLVGGIGIMNIMLVSVTERTREIGLRKALGAKRRDVLTQFLTEAAVLSLCGGAIGVGLGWIVVRVSAGALAGMGLPFPAVVPGDVILLAVGVAGSVGLVSGLYPAVRAARLDPIESLRHE
jgi:putative ABC transport system permease protein